MGPCVDNGLSDIGQEVGERESDGEVGGPAVMFTGARMMDE